MIHRPRPSSLVLCRILLAMLAGGVVTERRAAAEEWGSLQGQVVVKGDLPEVPFLFRKGAPLDQDTAICAAMGVPDDSLVVDPAGRGIANVFVYLKDPPPRIHPDLRDPPAAEAVLMAQNCRLFPHAQVLRTGQPLHVRSQQGEVPHTTHFHLLANVAGPGLLPRDQTAPWTFSRPEPLPTPVTCDIHPWMRSTILVKDHPYAAVTDAQGRFEIKHLPAGEQTFRVWHERPGYVVREWKVNILPAKTVTAPVIEAAAERLADPRRVADPKTSSPAASPTSADSAPLD